MEFDEIVVKESPGLCRCCLSEGCYKDLGSEYSWMSETEIYAEMLLECFDISISEHPTGPNGSNRLICEVCITRLRDACNFKKQVLESEKKFVDLVAKGEFRPKVLLYQSQMKSEINLEFDEETAADDGEVEYLEEEVDFVDEELLKAEGMPSASASEDITVSALPVKGKRGRPRKTPAPALKPERKAKVPKLEDKPKTSKAVAKGSKYVSRLGPIKKERKLNLETKRRNVEVILLYTNVTPFIWHKGRFWCFYCKESSRIYKDILEHTQEVHECPDVALAVKNYTKKRGNTEAAIKIEVSDMSCKLCLEVSNDLESLIKHLIEVHDVEYDFSQLNCLLPFRLSQSPTCASCNMEFDLFEFLLRHANKTHLHHDYVCDICGKSFFSERYFVMHKNNFHKEGGYECEYCDVTLSSMPKKLLHEQNAHCLKLVKCQYCGVTLKSSYMKNVHLANVHGIEERRIKCPHCPRIFPQDNVMLRHLKRVHLKEKNHSCPVCEEKFFDTYQMKVHLLAHKGEVQFCCDTCGKSFMSKSCLNKHIAGHLKRESIY